MLPYVLSILLVCCSAFELPWIHHWSKHMVEPINRTTLGSELSATTRAKVHSVADLMLEVYSTLADMRYLDHEAIQHGPHNINITFCHEQNIRGSIIYLWQILPYIDLHAVEAEGFIFGGTFVDFRKEDHIMNNRDPMYALDYDSQEDCGLECELDDNGELNLPYMGPEMTILSNLGNHQCVLVYDIETDRI